MDFEMRLSGDGLDDLVVTNEELLEASAAVSGLMDNVVNGHHHQDGKDTAVTEVVATTTTTTTTIVVDGADDDGGSETEEGEVMASDTEHLADNESADKALTQVLADDDASEEEEEQEEQEDGEDADMDALPPTQVINDDDEEEEEEEEEVGVATESVEHDNEMTSGEKDAVADSAKVVASTVETSKPSTPKAASPRQQAPSSPKRSIATQPPVEATPSPKKEMVAAANEEPPSAEKAVKEQSNEDVSAVAEFTKVLGPIWDMLEKQGWQVAQGKDTIFCAMPSTQFFNFRPNINVFDSKDKACWKFIALSGEKTDDNEAGDDARLWEILWDVATQKFAWYTMACGSETLFVKPGTSFAEFLPNETIFQTKKRAVLKCLEIEQVKIELGDSVEGHQVIDFSPKVEAKQETVETKVPVTPKHAAVSKPAAAASATTPSPFLKRVKKTKAASSTKVSPSDPAKRLTTPSTGAKGRVGAKVTPKSASKASLKAGKKVASGKKVTPSKLRTPKPAVKSAEKSDPLVFHTPEFKCTFGLVYKKLQELGWYHQPGKFEYDYFAPEYTPETAILNGNYFRSAAEFEEFLKDSGIWLKIKTELRMEHDEAVEQRRREVHERLKQQLERKRKLETLKKQRQLDTKAKTKKDAAESNEAVVKVKAEVLEAKKEASAKEQKKSPNIASKPPTPSSSVRRTSSFVNDLQGDLKVSMGKIVKKLLQRGWYYRPGRFEYDYFKPGVNAKTAVLNEDYFQSEAELEMHLKISGLWDEISQELREEFYTEQEHEVMRISQEENAVKKEHHVPKRKSLPKSPDSPVSEQQEPKKPRIALSDESSNRQRSSSSLSPRVATMATARASVPMNEDEVEELTNDIWANSHHFEFERR
ncbi:hypothetical protein FI667_g790, partial [Globisporangium splendens]